jgi:hypothetical protein
MYRVVRAGNNAYMNNIVIESPEGKKIILNAINAYLPDYDRWKMLAEQKQLETWIGQFVDLLPDLGSEAMSLFIECNFQPSIFLKVIKLKGYKVYWQKDGEKKE